ncbi:MAG TPA: PQQ-dependent sugar dehydrogenase [Verrucomicrobiae bacterium]
MRKFRVAPGLKIDLFASEPMIQNVVSFAFDEQGRCYVVESFRRRTSVFDIRGLGEWLDADFSFRTVDDRASFFKNTLSATNAKLGDFLKSKRGLLTDLNRDGTIDWHDLEVESERIRLLVDTNNDGRADEATTFAEGFDGITSGGAAGVLARKGEVWFTCIPDLWRISNHELRRTNGMPKFAATANPHLPHSSFVISNLLHGFGVHIAFGGHDLHGLKMGPDGKIYFSVADRGTSTNLWDSIIDHWPGLTMEALADSGGVFRCNQDGTEFEVVCIGLRNPQELAFDEFGNLFTGENNGDGGDKARWIHVVEGADYGWRMGWQHLPRMGAWNSEMLWGMEGTNTSAYYLPPVAHIGAGPSGVAYYPGTGLPSRYDRHFFMCDFRGGPNSVVRSFALRPKGASFEACDETEFLAGPLCTDVDFGTDSAVYVSDWVKGWDKTDKARIYRVFDPNTISDPAVLEVKKLLAEGFEKRPNEELAQLLGHRDMRLRLEAQFELAARPRSDRDPSIDLLVSIALKSTNRLARLHTVWAIGQIASRLRAEELLDELETLLVLFEDKDPLVRAEACALFQRAALVNAKPVLNKLLGDADPRVRTRAALALNKPFRVGGNYRLIQTAGEKLRDTVRPRIDELRNTVTGGTGKRGTRYSTWELPFEEAASMMADAGLNRDPILQHAAVRLLAMCWKSGATFDTPARLAQVGPKYYWPYATNANSHVRMGVCLALRRLQRPEVAQFLGDADPKIVLEAARAINDVPIPEATFALSQMLPYALWQAESYKTEKMQNSMPLLRRALNAHFRLGQKQNAMALVLFAANPSAPEALRVEALELLALWPKPPGRDRIVGLWRPLPARDGTVAAHELESFLSRFETNAPATVKVALKKATIALAQKQEVVVAPDITSEELVRISRALDSGSIAEKQNALAALANFNGAGATKLLSGWLDQLVAGKVPRELQLDVIDAVEKNPGLTASTAAKENLAHFESARDAKDALAKWRECLYGGNAEEGKRTFIERQDAACFRCHKINGEGGEVGPELAGIGQKQMREYILESILFPNKHIAPGFESIIVTLKNGMSYAGLLKSETASGLVINSPEDGLVTVKKADVKSRDRGLSAMPEEVGNILSKQDLRNLVEFLSTLKPN